MSGTTLSAPGTPQSSKSNSTATPVLSTQPVSPTNTSPSAAFGVSPTNTSSAAFSQPEAFQGINSVNTTDFSTAEHLGTAVPSPPISHMNWAPNPMIPPPFFQDYLAYERWVHFMNSVPAKQEDFASENPVRLSIPPGLDTYDLGNLLEPWQVLETYCGRLERKRRLPGGLAVKKALPPWYA